MTDPADPSPVGAAAEFLAALRPLLERIGATLIEPTAVTDGDVPLTWRGSVVAGVRLTPDGTSRPAPDDGGLSRILTDIQREFDDPLADLPRFHKQRAVRLLDEAGAFSYRKSVETVAAALGVSRFTVYNYLNRDRD